MPADKSCVIAMTGLLVSLMPIWSAYRHFDDELGGTEASFPTGNIEPHYPPRPCVADRTGQNWIGPAAKESAYATRDVSDIQMTFSFSGLSGAMVR